MKLKRKNTQHFRDYTRLFDDIKAKRLEAMAKAVRESKARWDWDSEMPVRLSA